MTMIDIERIRQKVIHSGTLTELEKMFLLFLTDKQESKERTDENA